MSTDRHTVRIISIFLSLVIGITAIIMLPINCFAKGENSKTVRVGYAIVPGYQEGSEGEYKTGYGYEYLQELAGINEWKYEYVYGSFNGLLRKLMNGEIDLMGNISYTDERAKRMLYGSYEQGKEGVYLYTDASNHMIDPDDLSTLMDKRIGVVAGEIYEAEWEIWCKDQGITYSTVRFDDFTECRDALNAGEIDAIVEGRVQLDGITENWKMIKSLDASPFYFAVNKNRPDLLEELNNAQRELLDVNPFYNEKVQDRNLHPISLTTNKLTIEESEWLESNGNTIKFGYLKGFPPLCYQGDDGTCKGVAADVLSAIEDKYSYNNIQFEAKPYDDYYTMFDDLRNNELSVAWPAYDDYWYAEQNGYLISDSVVNTSMLLVYEGNFSDETTTKIGVINTGSLPKIYGRIHYPESKILEYDSYELAINAILKGEVESVLYVSTTYNVDIYKNETLKQLNMVVLPEDFNISFAVAPEDSELHAILDRGIAVYGEAGINRSLIIHSAVEKKITLKNYFEQHPYVSVFVLTSVLVFLSAIMLWHIYTRMSDRIKASQREKNVYEKLSNSDFLTGLYNRKKVFDECRQLLSAHSDDQFVMLHIDMKHFRLYNTFFGDEVGDKLLCDVADLFRKMSQDYEYWTYGRIEADVFCAFFPYDKDKYEGHVSAALDYLKQYRSDFLIEPVIGMYFVTDPDMPIEAMFTRATLAAKEVKIGTPFATLVYDEKLEKDLNEKQQILNDMQTAVDNEEFKVYLQPKYSLRTNIMVGAEALVRWIHPTRGMISPGKFIPVFEGNGFITTLDRYMWEHVCRQLSIWKQENKTLVPVSVNVSRLSMYGTSTVDFLKELVQKYEIEPRFLELELTESAYMDNPDEMLEQMHALKDAGFTILLDDFGSGYSSLNTLRELPVDILKLDMKFLSLNDQDTRGGLVISSIIRMSKLLNLMVIAEGVELKEQAEFLKGVGCEYVQGFLFARPMPVEDYETLLEEMKISN